MHPIRSLLPVLQILDGVSLSPETLSAACLTAGWPEPLGDGIGLWELTEPALGTHLILDTITKPTTLICRLESDDDDEPDALLKDSLRHRFDASFVESLAALEEAFPVSLARGTYASPYHWRFAHFQGLNSVVALEQTHYDEIMGVQLLLILQAPTKNHARRHHVDLVGTERRPTSGCSSRPHVIVTCTARLSPVVDYHGLGRCTW